jgi:RHS repeat-associated protein
MRRFSVACLVALLGFVALDRGPLEIRQARASLPTASGAGSPLPLNPNFAAGLTNWITSGTVSTEAPPTSGVSDDATEGTYSNSDTTCKGAALEGTGSSAKLASYLSYIRSDTVTIAPGDRLRFGVVGTNLGPSITVSVYLESESFGTAHIVFNNAGGQNKRYAVSCSLSTWAGENARFEFKNSATFSTINVTSSALVSGSGQIRYLDLSPDPVSLVSGAFNHSQTDIAVPGRGIPLAFTRQYTSSVATTTSDLGYGWSHNYAIRLALYDGGSAEVVWPSGARVFFTKSGSNYNAPFGVFDTLTLASGTYTLTTPSQMRYEFDSNGRLTALKDRNDNDTTIAYDGSSTRITTVTDAGGRELTFTYTSGRITEIEDPLGRTVDFTYDGSGDLVTVTDVKDGETDFGYSSHRLTTITNALSNLQVTNTYDSADRVAKQVDAVDGITCFYYGVGPSNPETTDCPGSDHTPDPGETMMVDPRGIEEIHQFDTSFRPTGIERTVDAVDIDMLYTYETDSDRCTYQSDGETLLSSQYGNRCTVTDPLGNVTSYRYDAKGEVLAVTSPLRQPVSTAETGTSGCGTNLTGDGVDDDSDTVVDDGCPDSRMTYTTLNDIDVVTDARGNQTDYDYTDGNLTSVTDALGNVTTFAYGDTNNPGLVTSVTDPLRQPVSTAESGADCGSAGTGDGDDDDSDTVVDDGCPNTILTYDTVGNQTSAVDAVANQSSSNYDDGGRVLTVTSPLRVTVGTAESGADCGTLGTGDGTDDDSDTAVDDGCPSTIFEYDNQNNVTKVTESWDGTEAPVTEYFYDAVGNRTGMRNANRVAVGTAESGTNCDSTYGTGNGVDNDSDSAVDDGCLSVAYQYDAKNRLTKVIQARIAGASSSRITEYTYDADDNLATVIDPRHAGTGRSTAYTYDDANRLTKIAYPDVHYYTDFTYDEAGRRLSMKDTRGACEAGYSTNCAVNTMKDDTTYYTYDDNGRLLTVQTNFADTARTVTYGYDAAGNRTSVTYPDSKVASYDYDELNRMENVSASWFSGDTTYAYDAAGRLVTATLPSSTDITVGYAYDAANRLVGITNADTSGTISSFDYELDANGNRTQVTDANSDVTGYEYDGIDRLTHVAYPEGDCQAFAYDPVGNRTDLTVEPQDTDPCDGTPSTTSYVYDEVDGLKTAGGTNTKQDKNGNLMSIGTAGSVADTFLWDQENRLFRTGPCRADLNGDSAVNSADGLIMAQRVALTGPEKTEGGAGYDLLVDVNEDFVITSGDQLYYSSEFGKNCKNTGADTGNARNWYNGDGLRMRQRTFYSSSPVRVDDDYVWDLGTGLPVVLQDVRIPNTGSTTTTTYLYGLGLIAETDDGGSTFFYLSDGLGSTSDVVESDGDVANTYTYDVWGALRGSSGSVANQFDFTGEQADHYANRGLVYLRARFYDPALGRFLSRDRLPAENRYAYVTNNPVNYIDPSGLKCRKSSPFNPSEWNDCAEALEERIEDGVGWVTEGNLGYLDLNVAAPCMPRIGTTPSVWCPTVGVQWQIGTLDANYYYGANAGVLFPGVSATVAPGQWVTEGLNCVLVGGSLTVFKGLGPTAQFGIAGMGEAGKKETFFHEYGLSASSGPFSAYSGCTRVQDFRELWPF